MRVRLPLFPQGQTHNLLIRCVCRMPAKRRWTDPQFTEAAKSSRSVRQLLSRLGLNTTGSNYMTVWKTVERLSIDTSHWEGQGWNKGDHHIGGADKLKASEILVLDRRRGSKENVTRLRRALLSLGYPEICSGCGLGSHWNNRPLRLTVDHQNGNPLDNRADNLRFLCPNCHSQTDNFGSLNRGWRDRVK